jgi:hypothetical protein
VQLRDAILQVEEIRLHLARTERFRGFRSSPVVLSAGLAFAAALVQPIIVPNPMQAIAAYVLLWMGVAAISLGAAAAVMYRRSTQPNLGLLRETNRLAIEQFVPCLIAGGLATAALFGASPDHAALLPGMWAMFLSLGIFACWRLLPKPIFVVAVYYLFSGAVVLLRGHGEHALSPWTMAATFGVGQSLAAAVLYFTMERDP